MPASPADLAGFARAHRGEALLVGVPRQAMSDERGDVQPGFEHHPSPQSGFPAAIGRMSPGTGYEWFLRDFLRCLAQLTAAAGGGTPSRSAVQETQPAHGSAAASRWGITSHGR